MKFSQRKQLSRFFVVINCQFKAIIWFEKFSYFSLKICCLFKLTILFEKLSCFFEALNALLLVIVFNEKLACFREIFGLFFWLFVCFSKISQLIVNLCTSLPVLCQFILIYGIKVVFLSFVDSFWFRIHDVGKEISLKCFLSLFYLLFGCLLVFRIIHYIKIIYHKNKSKSDPRIPINFSPAIAISYKDCSQDIQGSIPPQ